MLITDGGKVLRCPVSGISTMGRATQGVRVMNLDSGERLVSMARVAERDEESFEGEVAPDPAAPKGNGATAESNGADPGAGEEDAGA
jgi:DNA gyrase subunit A